MRELYLHIGTWKTGTTSIQKTLFSNRQKLSNHSIYYPGPQQKHRFVSDYFVEDVAKLCSFKRSLKKVNQYKKEIHSNWKTFLKKSKKFKCSIISNEHLLDLSPNQIKQLKRDVDGLFSKIKIIAYVRDPVLHISSAINTQVRIGHYDIDRAIQIHKKSEEIDKIFLWEEIFGKEQIIVRPFEKEQLVDSSPVADFCKVVGISFDLAYLDNHENPSISFPALLIADKLARLAPSFSPNRNPSNYLNHIKGPKYVAPAWVIKEVERECQPKLARLKDDYGISFKKSIVNQPDLEKIWGAETLESIASEFNRLSLDDRFIDLSYEAAIALKSSNSTLSANLLSHLERLRRK